MKYAHIIETKLQGWYDDSIHSEIPTPNIEVTEEEWQEAININANCYEDGKFIVKDFRTAEEIELAEIDRIKSELKSAKQTALDNIVVEVDGKLFDGNEPARLNIMSAIQSSELFGLTEIVWKLADNTSEVVTLDELKMALALSIQEVGRIVIVSSIEEV